ncbi:MAG: hypothetical protein ABW078_07765 [Sedimenticola sp.]
MFRIEMLPAAHGDCLWIEYGTGEQVNRILIDGGPAHTYPKLRERILHLPPDKRHFDLLVITHIDADHIEGVLRLLQDAPVLGCTFDRIWFNGSDQLNRVPDPAGQPLGATQGEMLGVLIADYESNAGKRVWNLDLPDQLAVIDRNADSLPAVDLPGAQGDCRLTLLSPDHERLLDLKDHWDDELRKARIESGDIATLRQKLENSRYLRPMGGVLGAEDDSMEGRYELPDPDFRDMAADPEDTLGGGGEPGDQAPFGGDTSKANGSSIAMMLEYPREDPEVKILLAGDAWASVLEASIDQLLPDTNAKLPLTGFKIPHHGSVANLSESLLAKLRCRHYLVSTSGAIFRHPHERAVQLLLDQHSHRGKPCLHFNYLTTTTSPWSDEEDQKTRGYNAFHPKGISLEI